MKIRGFTLIEMLTTVAVLVIVLGLMVSLARDVRTRSAERLTKDLLNRLDTLVAAYKAKSLKCIPEEERKKYPIIHPLFDAESPDDEAHLRENEFVKGEWTDELVYALLAREWREAR